MMNLQHERLHLLKQLDAGKSRKERNKTGQYATPPDVANEIVVYALAQLEKTQLRYLEPGFGTGAFFTSLLNHMNSLRQLSQARGYEVDPYYAEPVRALMNSTLLDLRTEDFTETPPESFDLILCNPPYVRHHHMPSEKKINLSHQVQAQYDIKTSGLTGLYNYFMMLGEGWLSEGGFSAWLVPSEFLDVNYGVEVKKFLLSHVTLTRVHLFESENVQFNDALVSSAVVCYRKGAAPEDHQVEFSYGGSLLAPKHVYKVAHQLLNSTEKWTRRIRNGFSKEGAKQARNLGLPALKDFFDVKRGLATGNNDFFILTEEHAKAHGIPQQFLVPILPSPRYLKSDVIISDAKGVPINTDRLFLINCRLVPAEIEKSFPSLWRYLQKGVGSISEKYLCRSRKEWYWQEQRAPAPILCSYLGRSSKNRKTPFRFVLNESDALASNSYLMLYPKSELQAAAKRDPHLMRRIWEILCAITTQDLIAEGRTYGGGLEKMEPSELGNVPVAHFTELIQSNKGAQLELL